MTDTKIEVTILINNVKPIVIDIDQAKELYQLLGEWFGSKPQVAGLHARSINDVNVANSQGIVADVNTRWL